MNINQLRQKLKQTPEQQAKTAHQVKEMADKARLETARIIKALNLTTPTTQFTIQADRILWFCIGILVGMIMLIAIQHII